MLAWGTAEARDGRRFLEVALGTYARSSPAARTVAVTLPAPVRPLGAIVPDRAARPGEVGFLWDPPEGEKSAGWGAAQRIEVEGPTRFVQLRDRAASVAIDLEWVRHPEADGANPPRFFGGLAFEDRVTEAPWAGFGAGSFVLPRWSYAVDRTGDRATLTLSLREEEARDAALRAQALRELDQIEGALERSVRPRAPVELAASEPAIIELPLRSWVGRVEAVLESIQKGDVSKVVLARSSMIDTKRPISLRALYEDLSAQCPDCARFIVVRGASAFAGATPECLVELDGDRVRSAALAGTSAARGVADLWTDKQAHEHALVVDHIRRVLGRFTADLIVPERPVVKPLRHVAHLFTPIAGHLAAPRHILELAAALHPTPAVAGVPSAEALRVIRENEGTRGWYAGPIGWFDGAGNGQLFVALRSGLIFGSHALLFAGAGIVEGSNPLLEYRETALKARSLRRALGVAG